MPQVRLGQKSSVLKSLGWQEGVEKDSGEGETTNSEAEMTLNASSAISRFFSSMRSKKIPDHRLIARARVG